MVVEDRRLSIAGARRKVTGVLRQRGAALCSRRVVFCISTFLVLCVFGASAAVAQISDIEEMLEEGLIADEPAAGSSGALGSEVDGDEQSATTEGDGNNASEVSDGEMEFGQGLEFDDDIFDEASPALGGLSALRSFQGYLELRPRIYLRDRGGAENDEQLLLQGELELSLQLRDNVTGYLRPRILLDLFDGELDRFEPFEAYFTWAGEGWDLRAGQFVENWGIVDTFNPVDIVNRRDFATDLLDAERLGEGGVRARVFAEGNESIGEPTLSLYWLPVWRQTLFAPEDQRNSFDTESVIFDEDLGFEPEGSERGFYALRFQHTLTTRFVNADLQYIAARGPARVPTIIVHGSGRLIPAYFGVNTFGVGVRGVPNEDAAGEFLSTLTLKGEVVYNDPYDFDNSPIEDPDDYVAMVVGVDRSFYDVVAVQDQLTVTIEYAREDGADDPSARLRPFLNDIILRALWEANDFARTSIELRGFFDFENEEKVFEGIFETQLRQIDEDLKLSVQLQLFDPPKSGESLFDFFPNNSSLAVGFRWDF